MALSDSGGDGINKFLMINFMWSLRERDMRDDVQITARDEKRQ